MSFASLTQSRPGGGLTFATSNSNTDMTYGGGSATTGASVVDKAAEFAAKRDMYGLLLGNPKNDLCARQATTTESFVCHMDLFGAYEDRSWPIFEDFVTARLLNSRNSFLLALSPLLETPEIYFTVQKTIISSMPFTKIAPCGIPEEPSGSYTYSWKQTVNEYAQGCTINRDLVLDPNFGEKVWLETLSNFVANAELTMNMGIITTYVQMGYENMARSMVEGAPIDVNKLFYAVNRALLLAAVSPQQFIDYVKELPIEGLDTLIIAAGKSAYLRGVEGDSQTMLVQKLSTDPVSAEIISKFFDGPDSYKSVRMPRGFLDIWEFEPFFLGDKEPMRINPLMTRIVMGQYYPPNPFINPEQCVNPKILCGETNDVTIIQQTKRSALFKAISLKTRLGASKYWDKARGGKPSRAAYDFALQQTQKRRHPSQVPWDWNTENPNYNNAADINLELTSNSIPDMTEIGCKTNLKELKSWRQEFAGLGYDPETGEFFVPNKFGDFPMRSIPNNYIAMNARILDAKMREVTGRSVEEGFVQVRKLAEALANAEWTDEYLFALLDKNLPKLIAYQGSTIGFTLETVRTPLMREEQSSSKNAQDQCKFPTADIIEEAKGNRFGGWDVPDRTATMISDFPGGFASGVGILTLAQESLKEGSSLWTRVGKEAMEADLFAGELLKFTKENIGKTDLINPRLMPPWFHKTSSRAAILDSIIGTAGPVHVGVPATINYTADAPVQIATAQAEMAPDTMLRDTVAATAQALRNAVANNETRVVINNETRALACLSNAVYTKMRGTDGVSVGIDALIVALGDDDVFRAALLKIQHQLYDYAINLCENSGTQREQSDAVMISSIITGAFYDRLASYVAPLGLIPDEEAKAAFRTNTILKDMKAFAVNFNSERAMTKFLNAEQAKRQKASGPECVDYGQGYLEALREYEKPVGRLGRPVAVTQGDGSRPVSRVAPVYKADYTSGPPSKFIRAPIVSSRALRDYLRDRPDSWILISDAKTFYAYPEDPRIVTSNSTVCEDLHTNRLEICSLARSMVFQCRLNSNKQGVAAKNNNNNDGDLFSSLRSTKSKNDVASVQTRAPLNMGQFLSMGQFRGEDDCARQDTPYAVASRTQGARSQFTTAPSGEIALIRAMKDEYRGPWKPRLAYLAQEVHSLSEKWFFRAQIEAKNRLETPEKLANIGGVLLEAMIIRPFIELRTSAAVALKRGRQTMITTIGHSHVQVTKESRGCWHIDVGFYLGFIKINPDNVILIPHAFPESLIGGKDITLMTDFANLSLPNPTKESGIVMLLSADERQFDGPVHIANGETAFRVDIDYAYYLRKHSAGQWMEFILGPNTIANIDVANMNRETYATCLRASNILTQGPASYINPRNGCIEDVEGNGGMGSFAMNMPGVEEVYEGRAKQFPQRGEMYAYRKSTC